jgi:hypothetical protein
LRPARGLPDRWVQWRFNIGVPLYYYMLGRRLFGPAMKYPLWRFGHFPERMLRKHLYLDLSPKATPKYSAPDFVPIPDHGHLSQLPVLGD